MLINLNYRAVRRFPYRTATVTNRIYSLDGHRDDANMRLIESQHRNLAMQLDTSMNNHEAYEVETEDCFGNVAKLYIEFSDFFMCIGTHIEIKDW